MSIGSADAPDNANARRALRAAEELFKRFGFRAVTMEAVAAEARVSKATLYKFFKNRDELFLGVCRRMAHLLSRAVEEALEQTGTALDARLARAVIAKHRVVFALVRGSAHAAELFSSKDALAGGIFAELDAAILTFIQNAIECDERLAPRAGTLARALYLGSAGLAARSADATSMERELDEFITVHIAGARALAGKI
jgi:AcrR family transcriptional regulator